jgi:hypothetical protein
MLLALFFPLACGGCFQEQARPDPHYVQAQAIFAAVAAEDLVVAKALARELDGSALSPAPEGTQEHLDRLHSAIGFLYVAEDRLEGADGVAGIGQGCGGCHAQLGVAQGPVGVGVNGAWTGLWRGDFDGSLAASQACAAKRGVPLEQGRPDTADELDAAGAFALLLGQGDDCAPMGSGAP